MRPAWKTTFTLLLDAAATVGFFYVAIKPSAYAVGLTVAGTLHAFSFLTGAPRPTDPSFLATMLLAAWMAIYMLLIFAFVMEITRRIISSESLLPYLVTAAFGVPIALLLAGYFGPLHHGAKSFASTTTDAGALIVLVLAGAAGGTVYWLITVKLRAVLTILLKRLLCGTEPRVNACAFL